MIKEIKYGGYTVTPSDYECQDGDLEMASNLVPEDGALQPILPPKSEFGIDTDFRLVFIHKVKPEYQYILFHKTEHKLYQTTKANATATPKVNPTKISDDVYNSFNHVDAVGNTLMVFTETSGATIGKIDYYLWKGTAYTHLGDHIPDIQLSFGLKGRARRYSSSNNRTSAFSISFNNIVPEDIRDEFTEENQTKITEQIMAKLNMFIREQTIDKGRFCFPFLVRYALRLYDGTLTGHSAPILMCPSTKAAPIVFVKNWTIENYKVKGADCDIMMVASSLDYKTMPFGDYTSNQLNNWKDIVKSVDVFISKPVYPYDQNGKIKHIADADNFNTKFNGKLICEGVEDDDVTVPREDYVIAPFANNDDISFFSHYSEWSYIWIWKMFFDKNRNYPTYTFHLPEFSEAKVAESIQNTSSFYKLCSLQIDDIVTSASASTRTDITVDDDYLDALLQREAMTDDYLSHDKLIAGVSQGYNNRLNLANVSRVLYDGFHAESMFAFIDHLMSFSVSSKTITVAAENNTISWYAVWVHIKEDNNEYWTKAGSNMDTPQLAVYGIDPLVPLMDGRSWGNYVYYPNSNADQMVIQTNEGAFFIDLKPHDFMNGAFAFIEYEQARIGTSPWTPPTIGTNIVDMPQKIYTSEVNNPFYFPVTGINTVGSGRVIGISSAAKALSEGQFGQFPLYAFSTEGVWALEVSANGTYSAKQPITRDVCINEKSITQLDSAVWFATDRGIMQLSGSTATCVSDEVNDEVPFDLSHLPQIESLLSGMGYAVAAVSASFKTFLLDCRMIYDYVHQRIIVYNPDDEYGYAYVYSIKSHKWSTMVANILDSIPSYPQAYAVCKGGEDEDNMLVDYCEDSTETGALEGIRGVVVTRPFKLDDPDGLKTIDTIIQRGYFDYHNDGTIKKVQQVLYGSRDLFNWHLVYSSQDHYLRGFRGTPYKYFRLVLICSLDKDESLYGCTVQYEPRLTNKPR